MMTRFSGRIVQILRTIRSVKSEVISQDDVELRAKEVEQSFNKLNIVTCRHLMACLSRLPISVRPWVIVAIGKVRLKSATLGLIRIIENDPECCGYASGALSEVLTNNSFARVMTHFLASRDPGVKSQFIHALMLAELNGVNGTEFLSVLVGLVGSVGEAPSVRADSLEAIGLNSFRFDRRTKLFRSAERVILEAADDLSADVRAAACYAIGALSLASGIAKLKLLVNYDNNRAFGSMTVSGEALAALDALKENR